MERESDSVNKVVSVEEEVMFGSDVELDLSIVDEILLVVSDSVVVVESCSRLVVDIEVVGVCTVDVVVGTDSVSVLISGCGMVEEAAVLELVPVVVSGRESVSAVVSTSIVVGLCGKVVSG